MVRSALFVCLLTACASAHYERQIAVYQEVQRQRYELQLAWYKEMGQLASNASEPTRALVAVLLAKGEVPPLETLPSVPDPTNLLKCWALTR